MRRSLLWIAMAAALAFCPPVEVPGEGVGGPRLGRPPEDAPAAQPLHVRPTPRTRSEPQPTPDGTPAPAAATAGPASLLETPAWSHLVETLILSAIPDGYEDKRHWGQTTEVFDGVDVELRDGRFLPRISKEKKTVRHGRWRKYRIDLVKPEKTFRVEIGKVQTLEPGVTSFTLSVFARIKVTTRYENWVRGVKGFNMESVSYATVVLRAGCRLGVRSEYVQGSLLPDVVLEPEVRTIRLYLTDLDTHKLGVIGGDLAEELGDGWRPVIEDLLQKREQDLVAKARREIEEHRDELRLSAGRAQ
jgi:hypothetical protein